MLDVLAADSLLLLVNGAWGFPLRSGMLLGRGGILKSGGRMSSSWTSSMVVVKSVDRVSGVSERSVCSGWKC